MAATHEAFEKIHQPYITAAEPETPTGQALCAERRDENQRVSSRPTPAEGRPDSSLYKRPIPPRILNMNDESEDDGTKSDSEDLMDFSNSSQGPGSRRSVPSRHTFINNGEPNSSHLSDNKTGKFFEACNTKADRGKLNREIGTHSAANSPAVEAGFKVQDPSTPEQVSSSLMEYNGDNNAAARASGNSLSCSSVTINHQGAIVVQGCESGGGLKTVVVKREGSTSSLLPTEDNRGSHNNTELLLFTRSPTHLSSNTQASIPNKRKNRNMQVDTHGRGRGGHRARRTSDSTINSFYQVLPESDRRTQGYQPPNTPTESLGIIESAQRQAKYTGRADQGDRNHGSSNKQGKDHTTLPSQDARDHQNQSGFQGHNRQNKQPTGNKPDMLENTDPLRSILTEQNPAVANSNPPTTSDSKHGIKAAQASKSRTTPTKNLSRPMGASKAAVISPSHYMRRPIPDRSSLLPPAGPNDIVPEGNWDSSDAWTNPGLFNRPTIYDDSRDDIDFTARPVNDVKIKVAYIARDNSGKQVVQGPMDLANRAEYPTPATSGTKQPSPKGVGNGTFVVTDKEKSTHLPPHQRTRMKVPSPVDSSPIKEQVKAEQSEDTVKRSVEPWIPPHLRMPKLVQAGGLNKDKASQPSVVALPPHLRPPKKPQSDQLDKVKTSTEPLANDSRGVLPHTTTTAKDHSKTVSPHLVTEASSSWSPTGHPSDVIDTRAQPVDPASLATTAPTIDASPKVPNISSASLERTEGKAMPSTEPSSTQVRHDQKSQDKDRDARSGLQDEDSLSGRPDQRGPVEPSLSNLSMRGDEVEKLSDLSGSLHFDYAFQASNPSDIYPKISDGGFNPYRKNEYDNSLRGWDGDWGPAPIEWDRRDMYDFNTPNHKVFVEAFVINRIKAFKSGFCLAVMIDDEDFIQGRSLANGGLVFGKPIDESEHHHFRDTSPFTLHHLHNTAQIAIDNYIRGKRTLLDKEEAKEARKLAKAEKKLRTQVSNENKEGEEARNISKVEKKARKQVASEKAGVELPPNPYQPKANIYIRPARVKDLPQIRGLFNHYVEKCAVTGERSKLSDRDWRDRFDLALTEKFPFIVAVGRHQFNKKYGGEKIVGFAYAEDHGGEQTMWRHTCELQFYVHHTCVKKGVGKNLVDCIMRGLNLLYRAKAAVDFAVNESESARHDGGGERLLSHILVPYSYLSEHLEQTKWVGEWLTREFGFELQGTLKGIGRVGNPGKAVDIATYVLETGLM
ncbi:MAG: hypothetical protein Q9212_000820 [Teloschistes hypoglaucus]